MSIIFLLIPLSILFAACFLGAFAWAVRSGQYEDTCTPSMRALLGDEPGSNYHRNLRPGGRNTSPDEPTNEVFVHRDGAGLPLNSDNSNLKMTP
jgi:cbb3-type cytochrome oxidase maturation protein